ncbi:UBX domain-containing protein 4 [Achroia grisella]|uniref:UBX domain-containing protein 4 n=1 Tax=Achroia grisella TaxID=688607 RepID=UPI0027D229BD|nr:UBX domain-containing protein 4 [Achroia grisella]
MHWYDGSIAEAVNLSKQKNAIFVVFIEGDNELSTEMAATIDDSAVVKRLANETNFLAIKLRSGTTNYTHFAQIYQFVPVPSLFFIGRNGTPLEVVCAGVQPNNLATRIDRILEEHYKEKPSSVQPSTSSNNVKEQTVNLLQSEAAATQPATEPAVPSRAEQPARPPVQEAESSSPPAAKVQKTEHHVSQPEQEYEVVCDGDVCVRRPKVKVEEPGPSQRSNIAISEPMETGVEAANSSASMEDKLDKAKQLIEVRRREKAAKEKELEKQKELERRNLGQGVAELKRWQADQELKQIQEERKREKMENNLARQRILEQIAQDRAERRARDAPPASAPTPAANVQAPTGDVGRGARLQFKLPDGSSHTAQFDADDALSQVHQYIADNLQMSRSSFSLWIAFPRRELTESAASLRALQLAPSAALLVLPRRPAPAVARPSPFATLITFFTQFFTSFILEPTQQFYTWLRVRLFPPPPRAASPPEPRRPSPPPGVRRRGNIHRLPGDRSADDDNNTWNGNSTQQM